MADEPVKTEAEMRDEKAPTPADTKELSQYIDGLIDRRHDYGTCVYAMSMAAMAAFNLVAHKLGVTGFQASCADMDILRRTRSIDGPFMLIDLRNHMYPQYDLAGCVRKSIEDNADWFATEAAKKLAEDFGEYLPHPDVLAHWKRLATGAAQ